MTVQDMSLVELIRHYLDSKEQANYYYKQVKEAEKEMEKRYEDGELDKGEKHENS